MKTFLLVSVRSLVCASLLFWSCHLSLAESADTKPQAIISTTPEASISGIDTNSQISIVFAEDIDPSTLPHETFKVYSMDNSVELIVPGKIKYDIDSKTAFFIPDADLSYSTNYYSEIRKGHKDILREDT